MTLHVWGSVPVWIVLTALLVRLLVVRTQSASVSWLMVCCGFVALGLTVDAGPLLRLLSAATGEPNIADLVGRCLMICGLFALAQSVAAAARSSRLLRPGRLVGCLGVLAVLVVLFIRIDAPVSTSTFMQTYGDQPWAAAYSTVEMTYVAIVIARSALAVLAEFRHGGTLGRMYWLFVVGAAELVLLSAMTVVMDVLQVLGQTAALDVLRDVYTPVFLTSMTLLAFGAAGGVLPRTVREFRDWRAAAARFRALEPELRRLEVASGHTGLYFGHVWQRHQWRSRLHRLCVEIEDRAREAGQTVPPQAALELDRIGEAA